MNINEFVDTIVNSELDEWLYYDDDERFVFAEDIRFTIQVDNVELNNPKQFRDEKNKLYSKSSKSYELRYNGQNIFTLDGDLIHYVVDKDIKSAFVPHDYGRSKISKDDYKIAKIINRFNPSLENVLSVLDYEISEDVKRSFIMESEYQ